VTQSTPDGDALVGAVHQIQYALDTFNFWYNLHEFGALRTHALEAVQIVLPSGFFCYEHRGTQPVLAHRWARVGEYPA
jgi:hypothetical protein